MFKDVYRELIRTTASDLQADQQDATIDWHTAIHEAANDIVGVGLWDRHQEILQVTNHAERLFNEASIQAMQESVGITWDTLYSSAAFYAIEGDLIDALIALGVDFTSEGN